MQDIEILMRNLVKATIMDLSLWNCKVNGMLQNSKGESIEGNTIQMCYYFNLGLDLSSRNIPSWPACALRDLGDDVL